MSGLYKKIKKFNNSPKIEKSINLYDSNSTYNLDTGLRDKRRTYWFGSENDNKEITSVLYNKIQDYNNFRNIANQGMAPQSNNPLDTKKRKKLFNEEETTIFGN